MKKTKNFWDLSIKSYDAKTPLKGISDAIIELTPADAQEDILRVAKAFKTTVFHGQNAQLPKRFTLVPTKDEAIDYLFMIQLERDLGTDDDDDL